METPDDFPIVAVQPSHRDQEFSVPPTIFETPPSYMSEYFLKFPGKPKLNFAIGTSDAMYSRVLECLNTGVWNDLDITGFLVAHIRSQRIRFTEFDAEEWGTGGIPLNREGSNCFVLCMFELPTGEIPVEPPIVTDEQAKNLKMKSSLFYSLVMMYRKTITKTMDNTYGGEVSKRLNSFFQQNALFVDGEHDSLVSGFLSDTYLSLNYKRLICGLDMFFWRYKDTEFSKMRMATIPTRYRGLVTITALSLVAKLVGKKNGQLIHFVITAAVRDDVYRIAKGGEGVGDQYGYFPYHVEMGMTKKSAYSLSANPSLCLWLHVIGAMHGYARSLRARFVEPLDVGGTVQSGGIVGLLTGGLDSSARYFVSTKEEAITVHERTVEAASDDILQNGDDVADSGEDIVQDASIPLNEAQVREVLASVRKHSGMSPDQKETFRMKCLNMAGCPVGSVGRFLYETYGLKNA